MLKRIPFFVLVGAVIALNLLPAWNIHVVPESCRAPLNFRYGSKPGTEYELWKKTKERSPLRREIGTTLKPHFEPEDSIVIGAIGEIGYFSSLYVYDQHSLINRMTVDHWDKTLSSPGHDRSVQPHWFLHLDPTVIKYEVIEGPPPERINPEYPLRRRVRLRAELLQRWSRRFGMHIWRRYAPQIFPMSPDHNQRERVLMVLRLIEEEPHVKELPRAERIAVRKARGIKEWAKFYASLN